MKELSDIEMGQVCGGFWYDGFARFEIEYRPLPLMIEVCDVFPEFPFCENGRGIAETISPPAPVVALPQTTTHIQPTNEIPSIAPITTDAPIFNFSKLFRRVRGRWSIFDQGRY